MSQLREILQNTLLLKVFQFNNKERLKDCHNAESLSKQRFTGKLRRQYREFTCTCSQFLQLLISYIMTVQILANESILKYMQ